MAAVTHELKGYKTQLETFTRRAEDDVKKTAALQSSLKGSLDTLAIEVTVDLHHAMVPWCHGAIVDLSMMKSMHSSPRRRRNEK